VVDDPLRGSSSPLCKCAKIRNFETDKTVASWDPGFIDNIVLKHAMLDYNSNSSQTILAVHVDKSPSYLRISTFAALGMRVIAE